MKIGKRSTLRSTVAVERIDKMTAAIVEDVETAIALHAALEAGNNVIHESWWRETRAAFRWCALL